MKPRFTLHYFSHENSVRENKVQNQKQGHFSLFRSLLSAEWSRDPIKLAIWVRLLSEASFRSRSVKFVGKTWELKPGELVTTCAILASHILDEKGSPIGKRLVNRILKGFEKREMIQISNNHLALIIFITNYCAYQAIDETESEGTPNGTPFGTPLGTPKPRNDAGLKVVDGTPFGTPNGTPLGTQNNTDLNTDLKKISSSPTISAGSSKGSGSIIHPDAAIQSPTGKYWGTDDDLRLAKWIFALVSAVMPTAKKPSWSAWANDIRLIRLAKQCNHREIAITFKWANSDGFWQTNVLSPSKLRRHWDSLYPRSQQISNKSNVRHQNAELDFDNTDWAEGLEV